MSTESEAAELNRRLRYLEDRAEILDCISRHARGCDRHDAELIGSAYHPDAVDRHGNATNTGADYANWANATHAATSQVHTHNITTHTCEIDGDLAHCESYSIVVLLGADGRTVQILSGRYIDRLERREGHWRIALRHSTVEVSCTADARVLRSPFFTDQGYPKGTRDTDDLSYRRPLLPDSPVTARWGGSA
ncbi:nuclear transport factor 2 family protein [Nocardia jiangxiensis]|uniref:Nuclear transport factor 2 family protein n=1 Tax=Nocardia jiangxiensis TaxID=282685 RepID=A0ABW6S0Y5_9NOCA|nr:nuclear transport factor 2 family protein [Nocardia jiangxiensis]